MNTHLESGKHDKSLRVRPLCAAIALILSSQASLAQTEQSDSDEPALENIIVTAQKRSESIQEIPIAMQALYGDQLKKMGIQKA